MSGPVTRPFHPVPKATINVNAATGSVNTTITSTQSFSGSMQVYVQGANDVFVEFGDSSVAASTASPGSMPVKAGTTLRFSVGKASHVATATQTGSSTTFITPGEGI